MLSDLLRLIDMAAEFLPEGHTPTRPPCLIGHRGAFGPGRRENTLPSFIACREAGLWGVELDVRWTKDNIPIVLHDPTPARVYRNHLGAVANIEFSRLRGQLKALPTLAEVIDALGGSCHLMLEVKDLVTDERMDTLLQALGRLRPIENFHLLTLQPELLGLVHQVPKQTFVLVTEYHPRRDSEFVLANQWGGIAGHYLLLTPQMRARHHSAGQMVGVGFVNGINNLYRQMRLKADWIFSDFPLDLRQRTLARLDQPVSNS